MESFSVFGLFDLFSLDHLVEVLGDAWSLDWVSLGILLHELVNLLTISLVLDQPFSVLKSLDKDINLLVEFAEVDLHVLLLTLRVLSLFVTIEVVHLVLLSWVFSKILGDFTILLVVVENFQIKLLLLWSKSESNLLEVSLGVGVLLSHESLSSLEGFSLNIVGCLREKVAQVIQFILVYTHEDDIGKTLHWLLGGSLLATFVGVWIVLKGLDNNVGLQLLENLVISEVRELWQVEDWLLFLDLIVVVVVDLDNSLSNKIHLLDVTLVTNNGLTRCVKSTEHVDDELVGESSLTFVEEVIERLLELLENSCVLDQLGLHLWGDLLVENKLLNNQVKIVHEGLLNILSDIVIESWLDVEWLVGLFNLLNPHIEGVKFIFDQVIKVV